MTFEEFVANRELGPTYRGPTPSEISAGADLYKGIECKAYAYYVTVPSANGQPVVANEDNTFFYEIMVLPHSYMLNWEGDDGEDYLFFSPTLEPLERKLYEKVCEDLAAIKEIHDAAEA